MDKLSSEKRSRLMSRVRHNNTAPEMLLRKALWSSGLRYRLRTSSKLPGSPDLVLPNAKVAIFVDGCFWYGCPIHGSQPKTNVEFWQTKIARNRERDRQVDKKLVFLGWRVIRLWQHEIQKDIVNCVGRIAHIINKPLS
ncbi:MAG: very short patch repair endonuclease [Betaproteobacteria bacterium]|nr:very short patch repair endonuclease [Betaproteobacteria bacterium]